MTESNSSRPDDRGWFRGKSTCPLCKRTVANYRIGGKLIATDTDAILVVVSDPPSPQEAPIRARRLHTESCDRYVRENELEELRKEKAAWEREQRARGPRAGSRTRGM